MTLIFGTVEKFLNLQFSVLNADTFLIIVCAVTMPFYMAQLVEVGRFKLLIIDVDNLFQRKTRKTRGEILHFLGGVLTCNIVLLKCTCLSNRGSNGVSKAFNLCLGFVFQSRSFNAASSAAKSWSHRNLAAGSSWACYLSISAFCMAIAKIWLFSFSVSPGSWGFGRHGSDCKEE